MDITVLWKSLTSNVTWKADVAVSELNFDQLFQGLI